jgi:hypothetical protein
MEQPAATQRASQHAGESLVQGPAPAGSGCSTSLSDITGRRPCQHLSGSSPSKQAATSLRQEGLRERMQNLLRGRPKSVAAQASELRECEIGITPFDCPRDMLCLFFQSVFDMVGQAIEDGRKLGGKR